MDTTSKVTSHGVYSLSSVVIRRFEINVVETHRLLPSPSCQVQPGDFPSSYSTTAARSGFTQSLSLP